MSYDEYFVLKINEIYHDIEEKVYEKIHPEIFIHEVTRWDDFSREYLDNKVEQITLLDIGSGTGFVPLQVGKYMKRGDLLICSDISINMLNACKENILKRSFECDTIFIKTDGKQYDLEDNYCDFITLNSVLHHIPETISFLREINRMLKVNGCLIIGHEPNIVFFNDKVLWLNYIISSLFLSPKRFFIYVLKKLGLFGFFIKKFGTFNKELSIHNSIINDVNDRLLKEGIIHTSMTSSQISEIVDINSPTAGGYHEERGIDILKLLNDNLKNYEVVYHKTYSHLYKISYNNFLTKKYNNFLHKIFPYRGSMFFIILKKRT